MLQVLQLNMFEASATPGPVHDAVDTSPLWPPIVAGVVLKMWDTSGR